jgi:hypothetical protein
VATLGALVITYAGLEVGDSGNGEIVINLVESEPSQTSESLTIHHTIAERHQSVAIRFSDPVPLDRVEIGLSQELVDGDAFCASYSREGDPLVFSSNVVDEDWSDENPDTLRGAVEPLRMWHVPTKKVRRAWRSPSLDSRAVREIGCSFMDTRFARRTDATVALGPVLVIIGEASKNGSDEVAEVRNDWTVSISRAWQWISGSARYTSPGAVDG